MTMAMVDSILKEARLHLLLYICCVTQHEGLTKFTWFMQGSDEQ